MAAPPSRTHRVEVGCLPPASLQRHVEFDRIIRERGHTLRARHKSMSVTLWRACKPRPCLSSHHAARQTNSTAPSRVSPLWCYYNCTANTTEGAGAAKYCATPKSCMQSGAWIHLTLDYAFTRSPPVGTRDRRRTQRSSAAAPYKQLKSMPAHPGGRHGMKKKWHWVLTARKRSQPRSEDGGDGTGSELLLGAAAPLRAGRRAHFTCRPATLLWQRTAAPPCN